MEGIEFEEDNGLGQSNQFKSRTILGKPSRVGMAGFLVKRGLFKNETKAGHFLASIAVIAFVASVVLAWNLIVEPKPEPIDTSSPEYLSVPEKDRDLIFGTTNDQ